MLGILAITGPIYIVIALGYLSVRAGLFARADMRVLGQFVLYAALPALLFDALANRPLRDALHWDYLAVYALGSLATLGVMVLWFRRRSRPDGGLAVVQTMGTMCPNSGFVGYPINLLVLGAVAGGILGMNMLVENLLLIPLLLALMDAAQGGGHWRVVLRGIVRGLVRNPMVIGLVAGLLVAWTGLPVPGPVQRSVSLFAQASSALSLFVIGGSLAGLSVVGMRAQVAQIAVGKLIVHPLLTFGVLLALEAGGMAPLSPELRTGVLLATACPMFGIYPILAQRQGHDGLAAAALLGTTVASFFTISALLWMLKLA